MRLPHPEIGSEQDDGIGEVGHPAQGVGQAPLVEQGQQHIKNFGRGLFDFIEQEDAERLAPHGAGEQAFRLIQGARQAAGGGAINVFVHVEAQQPFRAAKEIPGQGLGRFGLADPCRPKQQQRSQRAPGIIEPGLECEEDIRKGLKHLRLAGEFVAENRENG